MHREKQQSNTANRSAKFLGTATIGLLALACTVYPAMESPLPRNSLGSLHRVSITHIEETENAGVHAAPYKEMAERIMTQAGFRVVNSKHSEFQIRIRTQTEAIKTRYRTLDGASFYAYKGAKSAGTIEVIVPAQKPMILSFSSYQEPPVIAINQDGEEEPDPALAPFGDAFQLAGGFYDAMNLLLEKQIPQKRLLRMLNLEFRDFDGLDYKGSLIRFFHERNLTSASANLMKLLDDNEFSCGTICPILSDWKYEPVLDYCIKILGSAKRPYNLEPVFETHIEFGQRRSMPSIIAFLRTVQNPGSDRDSKHQQLALKALHEISGQDLGNDPSAWTEWLRNNP